MRILLLAALLLLGTPAQAELPAPPPPPVTLKNFASIKSDVVRLGDLFNGLDERAETAIARPPAPGERVELNSRWLTAVAQAYGIPWQPDSALDRVVVERAANTIDSNQIEPLLMEALAKRGLTGKSTLLLDNPGQRLVLPAEIEPTVAISSLSYEPNSGRFTARVVAPAEGPAHMLIVVTGRAVTMTEVPVLQGQVTPGEVIQAQDIAWISLRADRLSRNFVLESAELIGKSPRRPVALGEPLRASDLREPITIKKNSLVTIRLETDRMVLTAQGRSLEDGTAGGTIKVMNTKSNTVITAVVADGSTVRVLPLGATAAN